ncbi:MAG: 2-hydroxychromene-2-carboxylate isomerase [Pseudomonadota bacterium]
MAKLEFYFDCSSPWTYIAITRVRAVAERAEAELIWRPILVGGIFNQVNQQVYETRSRPSAPKYQYYLKDLADWTRHYGLKIGAPSVFPVNAVKAQRACIAALDDGAVEEMALALCAAYWGDDVDISQDDAIVACADAVGLDGASVLARCSDPSIKERLKTYTQEVIDRGGFGSPTMFVNGDDMYFGQDRLILVEEALKRTP